MMWSYVLAAGGIFGIWLAGRNNYWGWALGLAMQAIWLAYALATRQYGFIITALGYGWVYWVNLRKGMKRDREKVEAQ